GLARIVGVVSHDALLLGGSSEQAFATGGARNAAVERVEQGCQRCDQRLPVACGSTTGWSVEQSAGRKRPRQRRRRRGRHTDEGGHILDLPPQRGRQEGQRGGVGHACAQGGQAARQREIGRAHV